MEFVLSKELLCTSARRAFFNLCISVLSFNFNHLQTQPLMKLWDFFCFRHVAIRGCWLDIVVLIFLLIVISAFSISGSFLEMHNFIFWGGLFYLRKLYLFFKLESDTSLEVASSLI